MGLSRPLCGFFCLFLGTLKLATIANYDSKQETGRVCTVLLQVIRKSPTSSESRLTAVLTCKKPKSNAEYEPGLLRQNASTLPLVPPPLTTDRCLLPATCPIFRDLSSTVGSGDSTVVIRMPCSCEPVGLSTSG